MWPRGVSRFGARSRVSSVEGRDAPCPAEEWLAGGNKDPVVVQGHWGVKVASLPVASSFLNRAGLLESMVRTP